MVSSVTLLMLAFSFTVFTRGAVGIDELLSKHIAHLFIRDPIVIFSELVDQDDSKSMDHFEALQSGDFARERHRRARLTEHSIYQLANTEI
jgi:hypothetical protein